MKSIKFFCVGLTLLISFASGMAQSPGSVRLPALAGTECIRDICLGDELGKFTPGALVNKLPAQPNLWGRKTADVLREMKPLYARATEQTQTTIAQEHLRTGAPVLRVPLTPAIHEALVTDKVQICGFATVRAQVEGRSPEKWNLVFSALPQQHIDGRQAWVVTEIEVHIQGVFAKDDLKKLNADLAKRAPAPTFFSQALPVQGGYAVTMRWDPVAAYTGGDISIGALTEKTRQMFGCSSPDAVPSL
jgi:hypothetical protein